MQPRLAAWTVFELAGNLSKDWLMTLASWKPSSACTPGNTTRASVSIWVMRSSRGVVSITVC
jgi:hypothetical protein